jgi:hypothetical protein
VDVGFELDKSLNSRASNELEETLFGGHSADYAWHLLVSAAVIMASLTSYYPFK